MQLYNNLGIQPTMAHTGKPLFGMNFKTENIALVEDFIYILARDYKHNNNQNSLNACINTIKHLLDQGYAYGSLMESASHIGYEFREIPKAIFLLEAELKNENIWQDAFEMVSWYTATEGIWDELCTK